MRILLSVILSYLITLQYTVTFAAFQYSTTECPHQCVCDRSGDRVTVGCHDGGQGSYELQSILDQMPTDVTHFSMRPPTDRPNKLSFTTEFRRFWHLRSLTLHNCGIRALGKGAFDSMTNLEELILSRNEIRQLSAATFRGLRQLTTLDLSANRLGDNPQSRLPTGTFAMLTNLERLTLADNGMTALPVGLFGRSKTLLKLDVSGNKLEQDGIKSLLTDTPSLLSLSLNHCSLTNLSTDLFNGVPQLRSLNLADNNIGAVPSQTFQSLKKLRRLNLARNGLKRLDAHAFYDHQLELLNLGGNHLGDTSSKNSGIHPSAFSKSSITSLDLSNNSFTTFNSSVVKSARQSLRLLILNDNSLNEVSSDLIHGLMLFSLSLSNCGLRHLPAHLPIEFESLRSLNISHNRIPDISHTSMRTMASLTTLDISFNRFTHIGGYLYGTNDNDVSLMTYMHGNPLDCHCHIVPVQLYLQRQMVSLALEAEYGPEEMRDNSLASRAPYPASLVQCITPAPFMHHRVIDIERPTDCALVFSAATGLTQKSELGIFASLLAVLLMGLIAVLLLTYWTRLKGRKGSYRTHELSTHSLSSDESVLTNPRNSKRLVHDEQLRLSSPESLETTDGHHISPLISKPAPPKREVLF